MTTEKKAPTVISYKKHLAHVASLSEAIENYDLVLAERDEALDAYEKEISELKRDMVYLQQTIDGQAAALIELRDGAQRASRYRRDTLKAAATLIAELGGEIKDV